MDLDEQIARCRREIATCIENQIKADCEAVRLGGLQGEMDWRAELWLLERERKYRRAERIFRMVEPLTLWPVKLWRRLRSRATAPPKHVNSDA